MSKTNRFGENMKFKDSIENYPSPIIAVNDDNFVTAKNYLASLTFPNIHVGAKFSVYSDINIKNEGLARGVFYGKEYTYFSNLVEGEEEPYYIFVISLSTFGEDLMSFNPLELYKEKVKLIANSEGNETTREESNKKRQYIRSVYNNLVKINYFEQFKGLFNIESNKHNFSEACEIYKIFTAMNYLFVDYFDDVDVIFEVSCDALLAKISEFHIVSMLLNSLAFSVLNSNDKIQIKLTDNTINADISIEFLSKHDVFALYTQENASEDTALLNSAFSLCVSLELAKCNGVNFKIIKEKQSGKTKYTIKHIIPTEKGTQMRFSSKDTLLPMLERTLRTVFYDTPSTEY